MNVVNKKIELNSKVEDFDFITYLGKRRSNRSIQKIISDTILIDGLITSERNLGTYITDIHPIVSKYNWLITSSLDFNLINYIRDNIDQQVDQESFLNKAFVDYFSSDNFAYLESMVKIWSQKSMLNGRIHIIKECLSVLRDSTYKNNNIKNPHYLIIPTLIAQIDGLMSTYLTKNGFDFEGKLLKNINDGTKVGRNSQFKKSVSEFIDKKFTSDLNGVILLQKECTSAKDLLLNVLFQPANPNDKMDELKFPFSRHKIMHGQFLDYGNIEDTIRLFLLIDFLTVLE
jgi:hypothetical protein